MDMQRTMSIVMLTICYVLFSIFAVLGVVDGVQLVLAASDVEEYQVHDEELEIQLDDPVIFEQLKLTFH